MDSIDTHIIFNRNRIIKKHRHKIKKIFIQEVLRLLIIEEYEKQKQKCN